MNTASLSTVRARGFPLALTLMLMIVIGGCRLLGSRRSATPTQVDRLVQAYPELQSGRFVVIADFEKPEHMELFQLISASDQAKCMLSPKGGRAETGAGCLLFTAGSPEDTIVINNAVASNWYLKRDWRPYDLLVMSIYTAKRGLAMDMTIAGGPPDRRLAAQALIPLDRGWNVVRLDLAEIGEQIPLDDVQELRLAVSKASKPVEVRLDDLLLAANRKDLFGDSQNRNAGPYVQRVGRRWKIGAGRPGADFELTFANGRIVEWYNVAADPHRLWNLVRGTTLGPSPIVIGGHKPGKAVVTRSQIVEMNEVRTVVTGEWRFAEDMESAARGFADQPFQRWTYTIYPTGQIYAFVEATAEIGSGSAPQLGLAVSLASTPENEFRTHINPPGEEPETTRLPAYAAARSEPRDAFLLYVVSDADRSVRITESAPGASGAAWPPDQLSFVAVGDHGGEDIERWMCHLLLGAASEVSGEEAAVRAFNYAHPPALRFELGSPVPNGVGSSLDELGFDPASGTYVIAPEQGRVRFVIDGRERPCCSPAFRIIGAADQDAWVYVDHYIFDRTARDASGHLLFQLPGTVRKPIMVEVLFRRPEHFGGP